MTTVTRPAPWPAVAGDPPVRPLPNPWPTGPCVLPTAVDPALDGCQPPTLDDLGLTADPVAHVLAVIDQLDPADLARVKARLTDGQRDGLAQYEQPRHLEAVA
ncbi:hypothetical protein [Micromonospora sp. DT47]|uniref:hypothetical protein n=1 Tax=Micromonospora sp. DT47 TaxID=3393431 RepID=UPI003CF09CFA